MATPARASNTTIVEPKTNTKPISWVDIEDDDESYGFNMPVQTLKPESAPISPTEEGSDAPLAPQSVNKVAVVSKKSKKSQDQKKATSPASLEKSEAAKSLVRAEMLARNLFPSFVEVTVDGAVPYSLKSTMSTTQPPADGESPGPAADGLNASASVNSTPGTSRKLSYDQNPSKPNQQLPAAIAATANLNVADRSHLGRRRRAIRVIADSLVSSGGNSLPVNDVVRLTKWNKTFRPGLGCLFSFIKSLPAFFVYKYGQISLTYEEDIASSMLRTWAETDPQAAELENIAASNAVARASESLATEQ